MRNILFSMADTCNLGGTCGFMAKVMSFWNGLGYHVQIGVQLLSVLLMFLLLSKLFSCKTKANCNQGCKCGCGDVCNCKEKSK